VSSNYWNQHVLIERQSKGNSWLARITPGYFKTLGTRFLAGRDFDDHDTLTSPRIAIVNKILNGTNPIGKTFHLDEGPGEPDPLYQIVGLVKDTKYGDLREEFRPLAFFPACWPPSPRGRPKPWFTG
jgi:putative ABC transport system permease protein